MAALAFKQPCVVDMLRAAGAQMAPLKGEASVLWPSASVVPGTPAVALAPVEIATIQLQ